jgi:hypothetical protein
MFCRVPNLIAAAAIAMEPLRRRLGWHRRPMQSRTVHRVTTKLRPVTAFRTQKKMPPSGTLPERPTAICNDGSYSFSEHPHPGGTCHGHGGVAQVLAP